MNQREKTLATAVGLLALIMGTYFVWSSVQSALSRRKATLTNLQKQVDEQDRTLRKASAATRKLAELQKRSLPTDRERANSVYQQWLLNLVDRLGFADPSVQVADRRTRGGYYNQSRFEVDAEATLEQLTEFLEAFYSSGDLHRIQLLSIKPIKDSRRLDVLMGIEAISLPGSPRTTVGDVASDRFSKADLAKVQETILDRSMFFPANQSPQLESITDQRVVKGSSLRFQAKASDPDSWDSLHFVFDGEPPAGFEIQQEDDKTANLSWTPTETGEYTVRLKVHDSSTPQLDDSATFRISVVDPPPADTDPSDGRRRIIGFDDATQTFLVGTVANGQEREAWFSIRTKGQLLKLSRGQSLDIGSIVGEISQIEESAVIITTPDGPLRLRIGQSLTEGTTTDPPSRQADSRS